MTLMLTLYLVKADRVADVDRRHWTRSSWQYCGRSCWTLLLTASTQRCGCCSTTAAAARQTSSGKTGRSQGSDWMLPWRRRKIPLRLQGQASQLSSRPRRRSFHRRHSCSVAEQYWSGQQHFSEPA